jgi:hypothetical protein
MEAGVVLYRNNPPDHHHLFLHSRSATISPAANIPLSRRPSKDSPAKVSIQAALDVALPPKSAGFASLIAAYFPALFAELSSKRLSLLWRRSRDGFVARLSLPLRPAGGHSCIDPWQWHIL